MGEETETRTPETEDASTEGWEDPALVDRMRNLMDNQEMQIRNYRIEQATIAIFAQYNSMHTSNIEAIMNASYTRAILLIDWLDEQYVKEEEIS